jgi:hypothetical protein
MIAIKTVEVDLSIGRRLALLRAGIDTVGYLDWRENGRVVFPSVLSVKSVVVFGFLRTVSHTRAVLRPRITLVPCTDPCQNH